MDAHDENESVRAQARIYFTIYYIAVAIFLGFLLWLAWSMCCARRRQEENQDEDEVGMREIPFSEEFTEEGMLDTNEQNTDDEAGEMSDEVVLTKVETGGKRKSKALDEEDD